MRGCCQLWLSLRTVADGRGSGGGKGNDEDRGTVRRGGSGSFTDRKINYGELATDGSLFCFVVFFARIVHADEWSRGVGEPGRAEKCLFNAGLLLLSVPRKRYEGVMEGQCCSASEPTAELATARGTRTVQKKKEEENKRSELLR